LIRFEMFKKSLVHCYAISRDVSGVTLSSLKLKLARSPERLATKVMAELAEPPMMTSVEECNAAIGHFRMSPKLKNKKDPKGVFL
jgi:hypothetical protein